jgi:hypothetical protein
MGCWDVRDKFGGWSTSLDMETLANLGHGYLKIIQKCIECDFSCGDHLSNSDLQDAIYTEVIYGLENQIKVRKKFRGID